MECIWCEVLYTINDSIVVMNNLVEQDNADAKKQNQKDNALLMVLVDLANQNKELMLTISVFHISFNFCFIILGNLVTRKSHGPTLLKDVWKLPPGKTVDVPFNSRNQPIGKEGRKVASFLGIVARTPELTPLHVDDWRNFDNEQKKKLVDFVRI